MQNMRYNWFVHEWCRMMSFNWQTKWEPVVAQGPSVAWPCLLLTSAWVSSSAGWAPAACALCTRCDSDLSVVKPDSPHPTQTHPQVQISQIHFSSLFPAAAGVLSLCLCCPCLLLVSLILLPCHQITSPLTHCWCHEPGTDYCEVWIQQHTPWPAGPGPALGPGVQWAEGRGSIGVSSEQ